MEIDNIVDIKLLRFVDVMVVTLMIVVIELVVVVAAAVAVVVVVVVRDGALADEHVA
jgi:hypothetical protein